MTYRQKRRRGILILSGSRRGLTDLFRSLLTSQQRDITITQRWKVALSVEKSWKPIIFNGRQTSFAYALQSCLFSFRFRAERELCLACTTAATDYRRCRYHPAGDLAHSGGPGFFAGRKVSRVWSDW